MRAAFVNSCICFFILIFANQQRLVEGFGYGSQLGIKEHIRISNILEKQISEKYASDGTDYSDVLSQSINAQRKLTVYHRGDPSLPVFLSSGMEYSGKKVHVLKRGEDYVTPEDRRTFVVMRQRSGGKEYNVHIATLFPVGMNKSNVLWDDARIEQQSSGGLVLNVIGNHFLPQRKKNDMRPRCEWVGNSILLCQANKTIQARNRKYPPILPRLTPIRADDDLDVQKPYSEAARPNPEGSQGGGSDDLSQGSGSINGKSGKGGGAKKVQKNTKKG